MSHEFDEFLPPANPEPDAATIEHLPLPYLDIDAQGFVIHANQAAQKLFVDKHSILGHSIWESMPMSEAETDRAALLYQLENGEHPLPILRSMYHDSGQFRTYQLHRNFLRDARGKAIGMRIQAVDVTESQRQLQEAMQQHSWLEHALQAMPLPVLVFDAMGMVHTANAAAERLFRCSAHRLIGQKFETALQLVEYHCAENYNFTYMLALERPTQGTAQIRYCPEKVLPVEIWTAPVRNLQLGCTLGVSCVLRPIQSPQEDPDLDEPAANWEALS